MNLKLHVQIHPNQRNNFPIYFYLKIWEKEFSYSTVLSNFHVHTYVKWKEPRVKENLCLTWTEEKNKSK